MNRTTENIKETRMSQSQKTMTKGKAMKTKTIIPTLTLCAMLLGIETASAAGFDYWAAAVAGQAASTINNVADNAGKAYHDSQSETTITNSDMRNESSIDYGFVVGNVGIAVTSTKNDISQSTLSNETTVENSLVWGNAGIQIGSDLR